MNKLQRDDERGFTTESHMAESDDKHHMHPFAADAGLYQTVGDDHSNDTSEQTMYVQSNTQFYYEEDSFSCSSKYNVSSTTRPSLSIAIPEEESDDEECISLYGDTASNGDEALCESGSDNDLKEVDRSALSPLPEEDEEDTYFYAAYTLM